MDNTLTRVPNANSPDENMFTRLKDTISVLVVNIKIQQLQLIT